MSKWLGFPLMAGAAVLFTGCTHHEYSLELKPAGDVLERTLVCRRLHDGKPEDFPAEEAKRLAALYPVQETNPETKAVLFRGRFTNAVPNDFGFGTYCHMTSSLGTTTLYMERFRGNPDQAGILEQEFQDADRAVHHLTNWLASQLHQEPGWPRLLQFMQQELRRDLKNLRLILHQLRVAGLDKAGDQYEIISYEAFVRILLYAQERGYFRSNDVPLLASRMLGWDDESEPRAEQIVLAAARRFVADQLGVTNQAQLPPSLDFLNDEESLQASWKAYYEKTPEYKRLRNQWEINKKAADAQGLPHTSPPDSSLGEVLGTLVFASEFAANERQDILKIQLFTPLPPYKTNGRWNDQEHYVEWQFQMGFTRMPPPVCYAVWAQPNIPAQERCFGKVVLEGEKLRRYVLWWASLSSEQKAQWSAFLDSLANIRPVRPALEKFRFHGEKEESPADTSGIQLILEGLKSGPDQ